MKKKRTLILIGAVGILLAVRTITSFAADGKWTLTDAGYTFTYSDGRKARGTWEDIDGEWYHFDRNGIMETGWKTVGNIRYHFNQDGSLSEGWQYDGPGGGNWYYYDSAGNAKIQWFQDKGNWYWFDSDGKMNKEAVRTIKGKTYAFRPDGSMRVNEYAGFSYTDYDGQPDPAGDILTVNADGTAKTVSEAEENEIAVYINAFPDGWRKKFRDDGWRFVYCPSGGAYRTFKDKRGNVLYSCNYSLDEEKKELRFSKTDAVKGGFGAYVYENSGDEMKKDQFPELPMWTPGTKRVYISMAILLVYMLVLSTLGFIIPSVIMLFAFCQWFHKGAFWKNALISVIVVLAIYFIFKNFLNVPIDFGMFSI